MKRLTSLERKSADSELHTPYPSRLADENEKISGAGCELVIFE